MRARGLAVLLLLVATRLAALDVPPKPTQWVNDYGANLLSSSETQQLNQKLEDLYKRTGAQFLVLIWPSLQGEELVDYTNRVANMWKVKDDKALMLFVFVQDRKTFIQVGYGLEPVITDAYASRVYRDTLVPNFRQGQYFAGINAALDQLAKKVDPNFVSTGTPAPPPQPVQQQRPVSRGTPGPSGSDIVILVVLFLVFIFVILPILRRGGCGGCSGCILPMFWGGGGWGGGGTTFGGGGGGGWSTGGSWGGGGSSFGGGGAGGSW